MGFLSLMSGQRENDQQADRPWIRFLPASLRKRVETRDYLQNVISNTGWQIADNIVRMGVGLLIGIWVARYLGPEKFGLLSYALAFAALFAPIAALGLDDIAVRNLVRNAEERDSTLGTVFVLKLAGGVVSCVTAVIAIFVLRSADVLSHWLVAIIALGTLFQAFNAIEFWFNSQVQAKYPALSRNAAFIICALIKVILILSAAPLIAFAWVCTFEIVLGSAGLMIAYHARGYRVRQWIFSMEMARKLLKDSWPLLFSCLVIVIYLRIDQVMLGEMAGSVEVGVYSVAVRLAEVWFFIPTAIYWSVLPSLVEARAEDEDLLYERLQKYYNLMVLIAYIIAIPVTLFANGLVTALFGTPYASAGLILVVLIWTNLFTYLEIARSAFFNVMNWNKIYLVTLTLGAVLNVALNLFLIPSYGGLGAAIASCISYWFAAHGACFFYRPLHRTAFMLTKAIFYPKIW